MRLADTIWSAIPTPFLDTGELDGPALGQLGIFTTETMHLSFPLDDHDRRHLEDALTRECAQIRGSR